MDETVSLSSDSTNPQPTESSSSEPETKQEKCEEWRGAELSATDSQVRGTAARVPGTAQEVKAPRGGGADRGRGAGRGRGCGGLQPTDVD
jgi:hypothetical protein